MKSKIYLPIILGVLVLIPSIHAFAQTQTTTTLSVGSSALGIEVNGNNVYVTNPYDGTISIIDKNTKQIVNTINASKGILYTQVVSDKNKMYVSAWGQSTLYVYNLQTDKQIQQISLGTLAIPGPMDANKKTNYTSFDTSGVGMAYDNKTQMLYVAVPDLQQIQIVDTNTDQVVGKISVGITPVIIKIDETTNTAYVTNQESNNVSVIDLDTNHVVGSILTGYVPAEMEIDQDQHKLYVTHHVSPYVSVIDLSSKSLKENIQLKGPTHALALDKKTGLLLVTYVPTSPFTGSSFINRVEFINTKTDKVVNGFDIPANPFTIRITDDERLFASILSDGNVVIVDLPSDQRYQQIVSQTVPEFGSIAPIIFAIATIITVASAAKIKKIPKF